MSSFEILCVTMHQKDFSKIEQMNIHSDVVFANQADDTRYDELEFEGKKAKMITTATRGVGINRNLTLSYASGDVCLFSDDDVKYVDNLEETILKEFDAHPDADVIIFNLESSDSNRKQVMYSKTRKCGKFEKMPWGCCRVAMRRSSVQKANVWFTTLFGGGCVFPSGEDSMWLIDAKRKGLTFYVSKEFIGSVSFEESSWFSGYDEKFYYGKGAFYQAVHPKTKYLWMMYFACRTKKSSSLKFSNRIKLMKDGSKGFNSGVGFDDYLKNKKEL